MRKNLNQRVHALWQKVEGKYGYIPLDIRTYIEKRNSYTGDEDVYIEDLEAAAEDKAAFYKFINNRNSSHHSQQTNRPERRYKKSLERKAHLIDFVVATTYRQKKTPMERVDFLDITKRYNWEKLNLEWNKMHPYDRMTQKYLKSEFYRATKENPGQLAFSLVEHIYPFLWDYLIEKDDKSTAFTIIDFIINMRKRPRKQVPTESEKVIFYKLEGLNEGAKYEKAFRDIGPLFIENFHEKMAKVDRICAVIKEKHPDGPITKEIIREYIIEESKKDRAHTQEGKEVVK